MACVGLIANPSPRCWTVYISKVSRHESRWRLGTRLPPSKTQNGNRRFAKHWTFVSFGRRVAAVHHTWLPDDVVWEGAENETATRHRSINAAWCLIKMDRQPRGCWGTISTRLSGWISLGIASLGKYLQRVGEDLISWIGGQAWAGGKWTSKFESEICI